MIIFFAADCFVCGDADVNEFTYILLSGSLGF